MREPAHSRWLWSVCAPMKWTLGPRMSAVRLPVEHVASAGAGVRDKKIPARGTRCVRLVRGEGRGVST